MISHDTGFDGLKAGFERGNNSHNNVILPIDGTYFEINRPKESQFYHYLRRQGYYIFNVIVVIDFKKRFKSIMPVLEKVLIQWSWVLQKPMIVSKIYKGAPYRVGMRL